MARKTKPKFGGKKATLSKWTNRCYPIPDKLDKRMDKTKAHIKLKLKIDVSKAEMVRMGLDMVLKSFDDALSKAEKGHYHAKPRKTENV